MDDKLPELLLQYGLLRPEVTLIRHNENRTYKVNDPSQGNDYLLRVHDPVTVNLAGIQHTRQGIEAELRLLEAIASGTELTAQMPVVNLRGQLASELEWEGRTFYCSLLRWIEGRNLTTEDLSSRDAAYRLGAQVAQLHAFFATYDKALPTDRPDYGISGTEIMLAQIRRGVELELFAEEHFTTIQRTFALFVERLTSGLPDCLAQGMIHADLNKSNILVTPSGAYVFIDYCLFGYGYLLLDVAMAAMMVPKEHRIQVVNGYYGMELTLEEIDPVMDGFMVSAVLGYYAFMMEHQAVHPRIREKLPAFCEARCVPFLNGERIFLSF